MPETVFGLPLHPLVVHATVVTVPLTALLLMVTGVNARARRWAGRLPLIFAVVAFILSPLSTSTGEELEHQVGSSSLVEKHAELGEMLIWWTGAMLVVAVASYFLQRRGRDLSKGVAVGLTVAALVAGIGTTVQVALIGHSGAKAVWSDQVKS